MLASGRSSWKDALRGDWRLKIKNAAVSQIIRWRTVIYIFGLAVWLSSQPNGELKANRFFPFFNHQAYAFLHGHVDLISAGAKLLFQNGQTTEITTKVVTRLGAALGHHLNLPPLNGFLFIPGVAVCGLEFSERVFCLWIFLCYSILISLFIKRHIVISRPYEEDLWSLALVFASPLLVSAVQATAWNSAALTGSLLLAASSFVLLEAGGRLKYYQGSVVLLSLAALSRWHLVLVYPLFFLVAWRALARPRSLKRVLPLLLPGAGFVIAALGWNWARYGEFTDFHYHDHRFNAAFSGLVARYGFTNWRYVLLHLDHGWFGPPKLRPEFPFFDWDDWGNGLFAICPIFLFLVFRRQPYLQKDKFALLALLCVAAPILVHFSTGWRQFGYRYALDYFPFLVYLLSRAEFRISSPMAILFISMSVWFHIFGVLSMVRTI